MTNNNERDPRRSQNDPTLRSTPVGRNNMLPLIVAAPIGVASDDVPADVHRPRRRYQQHRPVSADGDSDAVADN